MTRDAIPPSVQQTTGVTPSTVPSNLRDPFGRVPGSTDGVIHGVPEDLYRPPNVRRPPPDDDETGFDFAAAKNLLRMQLTDTHLRSAVRTIVTTALTHNGAGRHTYARAASSLLSELLTETIAEIQTARPISMFMVEVPLLSHEIDEMGQQADVVGYLAARIAARLLQVAKMPVIADHIRSQTIATPPELWDDPRAGTSAVRSSPELRRSIEL